MKPVERKTNDSFFFKTFRCQVARPLARPSAAQRPKSLAVRACTARSGAQRDACERDGARESHAKARRRKEEILCAFAPLREILFRARFCTIGGSIFWWANSGEPARWEARTTLSSYARGDKSRPPRRTLRVYTMQCATRANVTVW